MLVENINCYVCDCAEKNVFHLLCWQHTEQLDYVWICLRIILKLIFRLQTVKEMALSVKRAGYSFINNNHNIDIFSHGISRKGEYLAQMVQLWRTTLHIHCVMLTVYIQFCSTHSTTLYLCSFKILEILGLYRRRWHHTTQQKHFFPALHVQLNTVCTEVGNKKKSIPSWIETF